MDCKWRMSKINSFLPVPQSPESQSSTRYVSYRCHGGNSLISFHLSVLYLSLHDFPPCFAGWIITSLLLDPHPHVALQALHSYFLSHSSHSYFISQSSGGPKKNFLCQTWDFDGYFFCFLVFFSVRPDCSIHKILDLSNQSCFSQICLQIFD